MEEFIIEPKEDALKIVFGEKFDDFLFNDVTDQLSENKIAEMKEALGRKDNQLVLLDAQKLDILCSTLDNPQTTEEKAAYNLLVEAVDEKIRAFAEGKNDLSGEEIDPMLSLIQRRTKDAKEVANPEMYNMAINKAVATGQRYDAENGLSDVTKDRINLIDANLRKMESWQSDVTNLDDSPENCLVNIPEDRFVEFVQKRINGKENVTFADLQSALLAADRYKKSDGVKNSIIKQAEEKVKKSMNSKEFLSSSEVAPAKYIYDVLQKADRKTAKASKGFDKKINKSIERNKGVKVFETIDKIVQNTEVTGNPKIIGREIISQVDKDGKLEKNSEVALWLEAVRNKTICQLVTSKGLSKEKFNETFADNVALEYLALASMNNTLDGKNTQKDFNKLFSDLGKGKKIKIARDVIVGGVANLSVQYDNFVSRLGSKIDKTINGIEDLKEKTAKKLTSGKNMSLLKDKAVKFDKKCSEKFGEKYAVAKGFVKTLGKQSAWLMAFNVAKVVGVATQSTWMLPAVAAVSFANAGYQFGKDYFQAKDKARKEGKELKLRNFCKQNGLRMASLALSGAVTMATFGTINGGSAATDFILGNKALLSSGIIAGKIKKTIEAGKKAGKNKLRIAAEVGLEAVSSAAIYAMSSFAGEKSFETSKSFVDPSLHETPESGVGSSFTSMAKGKNRADNKSSKAIRIVPKNPTPSVVAPSQENNNIIAQTMLNKGNVSR